MINRRIWGGILTIFLTLPGLAARVEAKTVVYVSVSGEDRIAMYDHQPATGELVEGPSVAVSGSPGAQAVSPDGRHLYAALRSVTSFGSYSIDPKTGLLTEVKVTPASGSAAYVYPDRTGRFLLAAYYREGLVSVNPIAEDGTVSAPARQVIETGVKAHSIQTDVSNRFAFTPHTGETNKVQQFRFNPTSGALTMNEPEALRPPEGDGPRHFCFHPRKPEWVYFVNEQGGSVTFCHFDLEKGTLEIVQRIPTLPEDFTERNTCAHIEVTPDGKYLYASNRGHDSLAGYHINETSGELTLIGRFPTEQTPRSFNILPGGRHLVSAGQGSGKLVVYEIDDETGTLNPLHTYEVGKSPAWVMGVMVGKLIAN